MKNSDQLKFMYMDIMPVKKPQRPLPGSINDAKPINVTSKEESYPSAKVSQPTENNSHEKVNPKEARLMFYSNLAAQNGPTIRVQRPLTYINPSQNIAETDIPEELIENMDLELDKEPKPNSEKIYKKNWFKNLVAGVKSVAFRFSKHTGRTYLTAAVFVLFGLMLIFGIGQSINNSRQQSLNESRAQSEWEESKKQWQCALARYEATQNNMALDESKEKLCANIN